MKTAANRHTSSADADRPRRTVGSPPASRAKRKPPASAGASEAPHGPRKGNGGGTAGAGQAAKKGESSAAAPARGPGKGTRPAAQDPDTASKSGKAEASKAEATKSEATKSEATKSEATKSEATKSEATKSEATKSEATRSNAAKSDASRNGGTKGEAGKVAASPGAGRSGTVAGPAQASRTSQPSRTAAGAAPPELAPGGWPLDPSAWQAKWLQVRGAPFPHWREERGAGVSYRSVETSAFDNVARRMGHQAEELKELTAACREQTEGLRIAAQSCETLAKASVAKASRLTFATWALVASTLVLVWVTGRELFSLL